MGGKTDTVPGGDVGPENWDEYFTDPRRTENPSPIVEGILKTKVRPTTDSDLFDEDFDAMTASLNTLATEIRTNAQSKGWSRPGAADLGVQLSMATLGMVMFMVCEAVERVRKGETSVATFLPEPLLRLCLEKAETLDPEQIRLVTALTLIKTEVAEGMDAVGIGNPPSEHCPSMTGLEEELADIIIRTLDLCADMGYDADRIVRLKMDFNATRPAMHGGKKV